MSKVKKIAFITADDPLDMRSWSGTYYRMFSALKNEFKEVVPLGPIKLPVFFFMLKVVQFSSLIIFKKGYNGDHSVILSKTYAFILKRKLKNKNFDAIFAPAASTLIAYLKTDIPIFYFSDATVNLMIDYYEGFSNLFRFSIKELNIIEKRAIMNAKASIYASDWAAKDAISTYKAKPENIFVAKMGANIDNVPDKITIDKKLNKTVCNLLFLGRDWKRKGGNIVLKTFELLLEHGFDAKLVVCGCVPPVKHPKMTVYKFLNKDNKNEYKIFSQLLEDAHFLFLPTRAECAGIVFCEASANGIPSISTDTGGVSSYVENNVNGYILPLNAKAEEYAKIIINTFNNKSLFKKLSEQSRVKYFDELNWEAWGEKIKEIMKLFKVNF